MTEVSSNREHSALLTVVTTTDPVSKQLDCFRKALARHQLPPPWRAELLVVDDLKRWPDQQSADHWARQVSELPTHVLWYTDQRGQLAAITLGVTCARGDAILTMDPDMHECIADIDHMLERLEHGVRIVHGKRSKRPELNLARRLGSWLANRLVRLLSGLGVHDLGSPVTLVLRDALEIPIDLHPNINPRLYLYMLNKKALAEHKLTPASPTFTTTSAYTLVALTRLFFQLIVQTLCTRLALNRQHRARRSNR